MVVVAVGRGHRHHRSLLEGRDGLPSDNLVHGSEKSGRGNGPGALRPHPTAVRHAAAAAVTRQGRGDNGRGGMPPLRPRPGTSTRERTLNVFGDRKCSEARGSRENRLSEPHRITYPDTLYRHRSAGPHVEQLPASSPWINRQAHQQAEASQRPSKGYRSAITLQISLRNLLNLVLVVSSATSALAWSSRTLPSQALCSNALSGLARSSPICTGLVLQIIPIEKTSHSRSASISQCMI